MESHGELDGALRGGGRKIFCTSLLIHEPHFGEAEKESVLKKVGRTGPDPPAVADQTDLSSTPRTQWLLAGSSLTPTRSCWERFLVDWAPFQ